MLKIENSKILMHICCVGCGAYIIDVLKSDFTKIVLYFYNPSIWPNAEYEKRLEEAQKISQKYQYEIILANYNHLQWLKKIKGLEYEPEKGRRCALCYYDRLEETAKKAKELGFEYFGTTLTTSPHKNASLISQIGLELAQKYGIKYLNQDFKKKDGFKKSCQLSNDLGLYRQSYCGCEFSFKK